LVLIHPNPANGVTCINWRQSRGKGFFLSSFFNGFSKLIFYQRYLILAATKQSVHLETGNTHYCPIFKDQIGCLFLTGIIKKNISLTMLAFILFPLKIKVGFNSGCE
jgi:hypothetical protein